MIARMAALALARVTGPDDFGDMGARDRSITGDVGRLRTVSDVFRIAYPDAVGARDSPSTEPEALSLAGFPDDFPEAAQHGLISRLNRATARRSRSPCTWTPGPREALPARSTWA